MENKDLRWLQRFQSLQKAFIFLERALAIEHPTQLEEAGIVQAYEFTFELAWKTLKDYLQQMAVVVSFPREVIKEAFRYQLIQDGDTWMDMLEKRNLMSHTYDEETARLAVSLIKFKYFSQLNQLYRQLLNKSEL